MKLLARRIALFVSLSLGAALCPSGMAQVVGITSAIRNDVQVTTPTNPVLHRARVREQIAIGNDVVTGTASIAQLLLLDQTSFAVGARARVRIDRFVYDPGKQASAVAASVATGAFRFMSGRTLHANPGQSSIRTPVASIGIRGTIVEGVVGKDAISIFRREGALPASEHADEETATLVVLRGPGRNASVSVSPGAIDVTANGMTLPIEQVGLAVFIAGPGQNPVGPFSLSDRGLQKLHLLLRAMPLQEDRQLWTSDLATDRQFECAGTKSDNGLRGCN